MSAASARHHSWHMRAHDLGQRSETLAADYLQQHGWQVLERNYRSGHKEIDIIARRDALVAFVEVKARAGSGYGHPFEAITWKKRREIAQVAQVWLCRHGSPAYAYRFDAIAVRWSGQSHTIEHAEDAWRIEFRR